MRQRLTRGETASRRADFSRAARSPHMVAVRATTVSAATGGYYERAGGSRTSPTEGPRVHQEPTGLRAGRLARPRTPGSDGAGLSLRRPYSLRAEEEHEKYSPRQDEEPPASRCYRCCDPGAPAYTAVPVPQINITILKGQGAAEGPPRGRACRVPVGRRGARTAPRGAGRRQTVLTGAGRGTSISGALGPFPRAELGPRLPAFPGPASGV